MITYKKISDHTDYVGDMKFEYSLQHNPISSVLFPIALYSSCLVKKQKTKH